MGRREIRWALVSVLFIGAGGSVCHASESENLRYVRQDEKAGASQAIVVGDTALAFTDQLFPTDLEGRIVGKDDLAKQFNAVVEKLAQVLAPAKSDLDQLIRMNIYVSNREGVGAVDKALASTFAGQRGPVVTIAVTNLEIRGALVAIDAVAASNITEPGITRHPHVSVLPRGGKVFISGQSGEGKTAREATGETMKILLTTLDWLKLKPSDAIQVKSWVHPQIDQKQLRNEILKVFPEHQKPTIVFVDWDRAENDVEIEMVASSESTPQQERVLFLTPPGMRATGTFSQVVKVQRGTLIYFSALMGDPSKNVDEQVRGIFDTLAGLAKETGTDFRHLVKATFYFQHPDLFGPVSKIRRELYDPFRPAGSSAMEVPVLPIKGSALIMDMIAVPTD